MSTTQARVAASSALTEGFYNCKRTPARSGNGISCDCDLGAIDGCKALLQAVANAIDAARTGKG